MSKHIHEAILWEMENFNRIVKWEKDYEAKTLTFWLDNPKTGEQKVFNYE